MFANLRISQSINHGSPYHALKNKFILPSDLLEYLNNDKINFNRIVAYHFLCEYIPPKDQYLVSKEYFLDKNPIYTHIAVRFDPSIEVCDIKLHYLVEKNIQDYISVTNNVFHNVPLYCYHKLHKKWQGQPIQTNLINCSLLFCDNIDSCLHNPLLIGEILHRLIFLKEKAYIYYSGCAIKIYSSLVSELFKNGLCCTLSKEEYKLLYEHLPTILDEKILNYNNLCYNISLMSIHEAGYCLGFPIHEFCPTSVQIKICIEQLNILGIDEFCKQISIMNKRQVDHIFLSEPQSDNYKKNSFFEKIISYAPFDIVTYREGDHIFSFTRDEFSFLIEKRKNPWLNTMLPVGLLYNMIGRCEMSKEYGFPKSVPLNTLLYNLQETIIPNTKTCMKFFKLHSDIFILEAEDKHDESDSDSDSDIEDIDL